jgi:hypothetical protein
VRLYRKVHSDCTLSFEGSRYQVPRTLVGKRILIRFQEGVLRIFDGDRLVATHAQSPVKGRLVELSGLREAIMGDGEMNARKYASPLKGKAKATLSPRWARMLGTCLIGDHRMVIGDPQRGSVARANNSATICAAR